MKHAIPKKHDNVLNYLFFSLSLSLSSKQYNCNGTPDNHPAVI